MVTACLAHIALATWKYWFDSVLRKLSVHPNRAMQPRCAMRFESHTPKPLAMRKSFFASDAKTHSFDLRSQEKCQKNSLRKSCDVGLRCENRNVLKIERCEMPAIRTPAALWPVDASACDAKSLAMWVERCEPLSIDLLMGLFRGAVFCHGEGALKQPIKQPTETPTSTLALMGRFPSLMGRFPTLMGRFTDFVLRGRFTSWKSTGKQPIKKRGIKMLLRNDQISGPEIFQCLKFPVKSFAALKQKSSKMSGPEIPKFSAWNLANPSTTIAYPIFCVLTLGDPGSWHSHSQNRPQFKKATSREPLPLPKRCRRGGVPAGRGVPGLEGG